MVRKRCPMSWQHLQWLRLSRWDASAVVKELWAHLQKPVNVPSGSAHYRFCTALKISLTITGGNRRADLR